MRAIGLLALAAALHAQGPVASVQITAPSFRVIAGDSLQLKAVSRDAAGVERPFDAATWSVDNAGIAAIGPATGVLETRGLGIVRVTARVGPASNSLFVQILPKRVTITPASARIVVGRQIQFRAQALDRNDQPIPNVTLRWFTSSHNGFTTNAASVAAGGMVNPTAVGSVLVRASFDYSTGVPGFERQAQATATLDIEPPQDYRITRLAGTARELPGPLKLRARIVPLLGNDRGQVLFNASLDGLANGPLLLEDGKPKLLLAAGTPGPLPQTSIIDFTQLAINNRGEVLALGNVLFSGGVVYRIAGGETDVLFAETSPLPGTEPLSAPFFNRNCLADSGMWMMRANFRVQNQGPTLSGLFRVPVRGFPDEVVSTRTRLPDFPETFTLDNDFGLAANGMAYFTATSGARRALFVREYGEIRKLAETGAPLLGSTVSRFFGNGFWINADGELAFAVQLANNQIHLLRYALQEAAPAPRTLLLRGFSAVYAANAEAGTLFLGDGGRGWGLYLWRGSGDAELVFLQNNAGYPLDGRPVMQLDFAALHGREVTVLARPQDAAAMEVFRVRPGQPAVSLLRAGDELDIRAPMSIGNILGGGRAGPVHLLVGGRGSSIVEVPGPGEMKPVILHGERFAALQIYTGSFTGDSRKSASGDVFVSQTNGGGILRFRERTREFVQRGGFALEDGATANAPFNVTVNDRGDLLWQTSTNRGDTRLFLTRESKPAEILTNSLLPARESVIDGQAVIGWSDQILDEGGRAMAILRFRDNSTALYLYDGAWSRVAAANDTRHDGSLVLAISQIRAAAGSFYAIFNLQGLGNTLVCYRGGRWETALGVTDLIVTGQPANSIGTYDVNRNGDIFAQCNTNYQVLVVKRGDRTRYVHSLPELTPDGDLLTRTSDLDIRDDGTVYFLGMTVLDEYVLYMAKPAGL